MKLSYQTTMNALSLLSMALVGVLLFPDQCMAAESTMRNVANTNSRELSKKNEHTLTINFDESYGNYGQYYNNQIQMEKFQYVRASPGSVNFAGMKSPNYMAQNDARSALVMSCPEGSFDIESMCLTSRNKDHLRVVFSGTLVHDDECGITRDYEQGTFMLPLPQERHCVDTHRGFKDLSSLTINTYYLNSNGEEIKDRAYVMFDDIKIKINRQCNVDNSAQMLQFGGNDGNMEGILDEGASFLPVQPESEPEPEPAEVEKRSNNKRKNRNGDAN